MYIKLVLLTLLYLTSIQAQNGTISGRVLDNKTGEALIGANVIIPPRYTGKN